MNGINQRVYIKTTVAEATSYDVIVGETTNSINIKDALIDVSDKSSAWDKSISGSKSWDVSVEVNYDTADAKQKALVDALFAGTEVELFIGELGTGDTPAEGYSGSGLIESIAEAKPRGDKMTRSFTIKGTGALTPIHV